MGRKGVAGVILAGGRSSRMGGGDKVLLPLGARPMLAHVIERIAPQVLHLAINANGDPSRFAGFGLPVIADATAGFDGPLAGILAGLEWAAGFPAVGHIVTAAGDTPFFPNDLVTRLLDRTGAGNCIVMASSGGRPHPVFALWPASLRDELAAHLEAGGSLKVMVFAARYAVEQVDFPLRAIGSRAVDPFFNLNTPDDLAIARQIIEEEGA